MYNKEIWIQHEICTKENNLLVILTNMKTSFDEENCLQDWTLIEKKMDLQRENVKYVFPTLFLWPEYFFLKSVNQILSLEKKQTSNTMCNKTLQSNKIYCFKTKLQ